MGQQPHVVIPAQLLRRVEVGVDEVNNYKLGLHSAELLHKGEIGVRSRATIQVTVEQKCSFQGIWANRGVI